VAATASAAVAAHSAGDDGPALTLQDVRNSICNGLSSVRRVMTRIRAEMVVVKSQAASSLRRMDGLATVADGSQSSNEAVLERLAELETTFNGFGRRLPSVHAGAEHGANAEAATVRTISEIKVSERTTLLLEFSLRGEDRGARLRPSVCLAFWRDEDQRACCACVPCRVKQYVTVSGVCNLPVVTVS